MSDNPNLPGERQSFSGDGRPATIVPHNREAEEAVLGAVLVSPETYFDLVHTLSPDDFFLHRNRWIWEAFTSLQEQRLPIDVLTVSEELERQDRLQEVGGPAYLATLIHNVPSTLNAGAYSLLVQESATRRRLLEAANAIARLAHANDTPIEDVVGDSEKAVFAVSERRLTRQLLPIRSVLSEYYDRIDYLARHRDEIVGVPTGFIDLDRLLAGMQPSDLLIIAGRPGQGKSGFCLSVARNAAQTHRKHVALFSLEMSNEQGIRPGIEGRRDVVNQSRQIGRSTHFLQAILSVQLLRDGQHVDRQALLLQAGESFPDPPVAMKEEVVRRKGVDQVEVGLRADQDCPQNGFFRFAVVRDNRQRTSVAGKGLPLAGGVGALAHLVVIRTGRRRKGNNPRRRSGRDGLVTRVGLGRIHVVQVERLDEVLEDVQPLVALAFGLFR